MSVAQYITEAGFMKDVEARGLTPHRVKYGWVVTKENMDDVVGEFDLLHNMGALWDTNKEYRSYWGFED